MRGASPEVKEKYDPDDCIFFDAVERHHQLGKWKNISDLDVDVCSEYDGAFQIVVFGRSVKEYLVTVRFRQEDGDLSAKKYVYHSEQEMIKHTTAIVKVGSNYKLTAVQDCEPYSAMRERDIKQLLRRWYSLNWLHGGVYSV